VSEMLSGRKIEELLATGESDAESGIGCSPNPCGYDKTQIGGGSLDVRLGCWFLVMQQSRRSVIDLAKSDSKGLENTDGKYYYVPFGKSFVVHPGRFVLGATLEWLSFPANMGGFITGKSSLGRRGLIIETAAGIQPSFNGCLTLEIYNCGEVPISITPGMRIAQIFFHLLHGEESTQRSQFRGKRKPIFGTHRHQDFREIEIQTNLEV